MNTRDYLAVAATKPTLVCGVPTKLMLANGTLSIMPGLYINTIFYNGESMLALFGCWALIFFTIHRIALFYTRRDVNFISVFYKSLTKSQRVRNANFWQGQNSYRA